FEDLFIGIKQCDPQTQRVGIPDGGAAANATPDAGRSCPQTALVRSGSVPEEEKLSLANEGTHFWYRGDRAAYDIEYTRSFADAAEFVVTRIDPAPPRYQPPSHN
ncbi:MAG TPA: hypothetical protein VN345_08860, partial [Blastocatellia bacterium]|nr:hypothetical protein [Blastocatellia bacterium]